MIDYSNKEWLRPEALGSRVTRLLWQMVIVGLILFALAWIIGKNEAHGAGVRAVLFENSSVPISFDEAMRTRPELGRPLSCRSQQSRTNEPWHHRICFYTVSVTRRASALASRERYDDGNARETESDLG